MRKIPLFLAIFIFSCNGPSIQKVSNDVARQLKTVYFMDTTTNLCFGGIYGKEDRPVRIDAKTFSCVPCDSLKNVHISKIGN
jgi:hypothetical protein